jgi:tellurite resistance protein TehA-like permease
MQLLINVLIGIVIFAILGYGLYLICTKFFPNFAPALWICGVILIIVLLVLLSTQMGGTGNVGPSYTFPPWHGK